MELSRHYIAGQELILHPYRAIYWVEERALLLADLHLGKAEHFRKEGLPVPGHVSNVNWDKLIGLLLEFKPERVLFLGDLFHSDFNAQWEDLRELVQQFHGVRFELVKGNHDILHGSFYDGANITVHDEGKEEGPFLLTHHPMQAYTGPLYNLSGHLHPCVFMRGRGRQRLRLPCFYFGAHQGILPAFGAFTGMAPIQPREGDGVFVITDELVLPVH